MDADKKKRGWITVDNPPGHSKPEWMRSAGIDDDGTVWVPAVIAGNEKAIMLCASYDGESALYMSEHLFVRSSWMRREYKDTHEVLDAIERTVAASLKKEAEAIAQLPNEPPAQESKPDYAVEQAEIEQLAMQVAEAVYQAVKNRFAAHEQHAPQCTEPPEKKQPAAKAESLKGWFFVTADADQMVGNQGQIEAVLPNNKYRVVQFSWISGEPAGHFIVDADTAQTYFTLTGKKHAEHDDFCFIHEGGKKLSTPPYEIGKGPLLETERPES